MKRIILSFLMMLCASAAYAGIERGFDGMSRSSEELSERGELETGFYKLLITWIKKKKEEEVLTKDEAILALKQADEVVDCWMVKPLDVCSIFAGEKKMRFAWAERQDDDKHINDLASLVRGGNSSICCIHCHD